MFWKYLRPILCAAFGALCFAAPAFAQDAAALPDLSQLSLITTTKHHRPADPLNVALVGSRDEIIAVMQAAGWQPADPVTFRSSAHIIRSVALRRAYLTAPVSALYYQGRRQDLAFEQEVGRSASRRHHVRFWKVSDDGPGGRPLWLGDATYDRSVGLSHHGSVTHHISGDVDAERAFLIDGLNKTAQVASVTTLKGAGPRRARNGGGDLYWTDGDVALAVVARATAQ